MVQYQAQQPISLPAATLAVDDPMRILLYNVGYCTELNGSWFDYLVRSYRYLYTPRRVKSSAVHSLARMVEAHNPDVCCFVEIHKNMKELPHFSAYAEYDIENKYGMTSMLRRMPYFRKNCNGFFSRKPLEFRKHWLKNGSKKLIYEIDLAKDTKLLFAHLSLRAKTRRKQFQDLKKWVKKNERVILCGDFNTFRGEEDLEQFARDCNLRIFTPKTRGTFPAKKPRKSIDLFLCSMNIDMKNIEVLDHVRASDHLPVLVEMKL